MTLAQPNAAGDSRQRRAFGVGLALIVVAQVCFHAPLAAQRGFVEDDFCWLEDARLAQDQPAHLFTNHISGFLRPVIHASFAVNYRLAGLDARSYYAFNILLEVACTLALALLLRRLGLGVAACLAGTLAFTSHATHAEVLGWVSGRTTSIWAFLGLLTLLFWLRARQTSSIAAYTAAFVCHLLSLAAKEEAVALLPILVVADFLVARPAGSGRRRAAAFVPHAMLWTAYLAVQYYVQSTNPLVREGVYTFGVASLLNWLYRVPSLFYRNRFTAGGEALVAALICTLFLTITLRQARATWLRIFLLGLASILIALAPTSLFHFQNARPGELAIRYSYFASAGAAIIWAVAWQAASERPTRRWFAVIATVAILSIVSQHSRQRSELVRWHQKAADGQAIYRAIAESSTLDQAPPDPTRPIIVFSPPMGLAHLRSAIWLAKGIAPLRIQDDDLARATLSALPAGVTVLQWDPRAGMFKLIQK